MTITATKAIMTTYSSSIGIPPVEVAGEVSEGDVEADVVGFPVGFTEGLVDGSFDTFHRFVLFSSRCCV